METKLTLENIACYLPHDLLVQGNDGVVGKMVAEIGLESPSVTIGAVLRNNGFYKPLLSPMYQLTETITIDGEEIIPIVELAKIAFPNREWKSKDGYATTNDSLEGLRFAYANGSFRVSGIEWKFGHVPNQLQLFQWLYKNKFDVENLIGQNLAIPVTKDNNPYN